ncbi:MAG: aminomethyl-transferring glycine dehydrogenase subunit GcvPB [Gammaproteobacteria bacterium]|nr:aminomethyl-transferring glycine dehydrogenase subunit GcvPB [Gammaproteobacteria bacterium]
MPFIPHSDRDKQEMVAYLGLEFVEELFAEIPESISNADFGAMPDSLSEMAVARLMQERSAENKSKLCFAGAGAYDHYVPAAVWDLVLRGEFLTAYTPYQAEASQGTLQAIYEYQTMMCSLTGMDVANASLYDGASAVAEAILMAVRCHKGGSKQVLVPENLHPTYRKVIDTIAGPQKIELINIPFNKKTGEIKVDFLQQFKANEIAAVIINQPNFFGVIESVDALTDVAHAIDALVISVINPLAISILKEPGAWGDSGADIVVGDGQPLGCNLSSGGPYFGFLCCKEQFLREMPGRIVGKTTDQNGKEGYILNLQTREQHIRRAKATSNICSNQGLMVIAAAVFMSLLGADGLQKRARVCCEKANFLKELICKLDGVELVFNGNNFNEFVIKLNVPDSFSHHPDSFARHPGGRQDPEANENFKYLLNKLDDLGIQAGFDLSKDYPELKNCLLVAVTETKTDDDLLSYVNGSAEVLGEFGAEYGGPPVPTAQARRMMVPFSDICAKQVVRTSPLNLPNMSELEVVRHYTKLSQKNFAVDTAFYPLGSCTMKYNPKVQKLALLPGFLQQHPYAMAANNQGTLACLYELQEMLKIITGMSDVSLAPMAGAQGEFAGCAMIRAYHLARGDNNRTEMLVPDAAHGTNPASAVMSGFKVVEVKTKKDGDLDLEHLQSLLSDKTAGIMLTNPSTLGVFEREILKISSMIHQAGGLLYYDGANLNAILGKVKPANMGFDVLHLNLHKTFATPHGTGGPGAAPVLCNDKLKPFLPIPIVYKDPDTLKKQNQYFLNNNIPQTIGPLSAFSGNVNVLLQAYIYLRMIGKQNLSRISEYAVLNSNYLMKKLAEIGYTVPLLERLASHEFIVSLIEEKKSHKVTAMDVAKRLLDYGIHSPTCYFPLLIPESLLIEPTETESKQQLDRFIGIMRNIYNEIHNNPEILSSSPNNLTFNRLDAVYAAQHPKLKNDS